MKTTVEINEINDYYEYEVDITLSRTPGQVMENLATIEVRLYEKDGDNEKKADGETTARSLINTYKEEVKRPNIVQFMLGTSWIDRIEYTKQDLRTKAIYQAAELWHSEIFPKELREIMKDMTNLNGIGKE